MDPGEPVGIAAGLSGMWMAVFSDLPVYDNTALIWLRLFFGSLMVAGLVLGVRAVLRHDVRTHQRWMAQAYAVGMGSPGSSTLAVAEWLVRRSQSAQVRLMGWVD